MRLLTTEDGNMGEFMGTAIPSRYAILSHRWGEEEVSFQDWSARSRSDVHCRHGHQKIMSFLEQAKKDGLEYAWVDTCCIDKSSSQELSEAINSMFDWYRNASICYVYLHDYHSTTFNAAELEQCEWFRRGWTLQELIAPRNVRFYNSGWETFGSKSDHDTSEVISAITQIDTKFREYYLKSFLMSMDSLQKPSPSTKREAWSQLPRKPSSYLHPSQTKKLLTQFVEVYGADLESASIAKRMSWASRRETTRPEDIAYCLLGLFDINIPLLYGEGSKAFKRLQEEILKMYPTDHTLYAWGTPTDRCSLEVPEPMAKYAIWEGIDDQLGDIGPLSGLLAKSPINFKDSRHYSPLPFVDNFFVDAVWEGVKPLSHPVAAGKGIRITFPHVLRRLFYCQFTEPLVTHFRYGYYAVLLCQDERDELVTLFLPLLRWGSGYYARVGQLYCDRDIRLFQQHPLEYFNMTTLVVAAFRPDEFMAGDITLRSVTDSRPGHDLRKEPPDFRVITHEAVDMGCDITVRTNPNLSVWCYPSFINTTRGNSENWLICLGRTDTGTISPPFRATVVIGGDENDASEILACPKNFQSPLDAHSFAHESLPHIEIRVERRMLTITSGFTDIVDISVSERIPEKDDDFEYLGFGTASGLATIIHLKFKS